MEEAALPPTLLGLGWRAGPWGALRPGSLMQSDLSHVMADFRGKVHWGSGTLSQSFPALVPGETNAPRDMCKDSSWEGDLNNRPRPHHPSVSDKMLSLQAVEPRFLQLGPRCWDLQGRGEDNPGTSVMFLCSRTHDHHCLHPLGRTASVGIRRQRGPTVSN